MDVVGSSVAASPSAVVADGSKTSSITVTLTDSLGVPVSGKDVTLANTAGPQAAVIDPLTAVTTDANGRATFTVRSGTPGIEEFTATNTMDSLVVTQTATVTFVGAAEAGLSTVAASPLFVPADGTSTSTITVTVLGLGNSPLAGKNVTLANTSGPQSAVISPAGAVTSGANGVATFTVRSGTAGAEGLTATVATDSVVITQTATVNFVGQSDAALSTVAASRASVVANGTTTSTITVSLKDANGFPVAGNEVTLANTAGPQAAVVNPLTAVTTDANGQASFTVSSSTQGTETFTATDTTDSVGVTQTASVTFINSATPLAFNVNFFEFTGGGQNGPENPADLVGPAGGAGETWNQFNARLGANFLDANGVATGVGFTSGYTEGRQWGNPPLKMLSSGLSHFGRGILTTTTITGLPPGSVYNVWIASRQANSSPAESSFGAWSTSNPTTTARAQVVDARTAPNQTTWQEGMNYALLANVQVNGSGEIVIQGAPDAANRLPLSGFQLVPAGRAVITAFGIAGLPGVIDENARTITLNVPFGTDLATLAPTFTLTSGTANQTSGAPPSPTFAAANPVQYTVTDSVNPVTVNTYTVTVVVGKPFGTLVIDLGAGTTIGGSTFGTYGATHLPLPPLPAGSILRSIAVDTVLEATDNDNFASDLAVLIDPTPATPGEDFSVIITNGEVKFGAGLQLPWPANADVGAVAPLIDLKGESTWAAAGVIDLATSGLFLGNSFGGPILGGTWSGTITLTYDLVGEGSGYDAWSGGAPADGDANGDGVINGVAWALGAANPNVNALSLLPTIDTTSDPDYAIFSFNRSDAANDDPATTITVEYSAKLEGWVPAVHDGDTVIIEVTPGGPTDEVRVKLKRSSLADEGTIFARLKVVVAP
jgi:hypothetical protein